MISTAFACWILFPDKSLEEVAFAPFGVGLTCGIGQCRSWDRTEESRVLENAVEFVTASELTQTQTQSADDAERG